MSRGGARPGSGRKKGAKVAPTDAELQRSLRSQMRHHGAELVDVQTADGKWIKMSRIQVVLSKLYQLGAQGNVVAAKEYGDRVVGKAEQPVGTPNDDGDITIKIDC